MGDTKFKEIQSTKRDKRGIGYSHRDNLLKKSDNVVWREKNELFKKMMLNKLGIYIQKYAYLYLRLYKKINSRWVIVLNVKIVNFIQKCEGNHRIPSRFFFFKQNTKSTKIKKNIDNLRFIKIKIC